MSKSANKHNRLYCTAEPLNEDLALEMENGTISMKMDTKELTKDLLKYGFDKTEVARFWAFGVSVTPFASTQFRSQPKFYKIFNFRMRKFESVDSC